MATYGHDDDVDTIVASNLSPKRQISPPPTIDLAQAVRPIPKQIAIADSGATQIFIMDGTPVKNKRTTTYPLKVALADGRQVLSTHICNVDIPGLPVTLVGHFIPDLSIASLFAIRVLTDVGCTVTFDVNKCVVYFKGYEILRGYKDPTTDLWTIPLGMTTHASAQHDRDMPLLACPKLAKARTCSDSPVADAVHIATFAHTVRTKANSIKFAHQLFCSPRISTFLKAIRRGFLTGCPNLTSTGVTRYLNHSPASSKGHMKRPHQGIRSTRQCVVPQPTVQQETIPHRTYAHEFPEQMSANNNDASSHSESYASY